VCVCVVDDLLDCASWKRGACVWNPWDFKFVNFVDVSDPDPVFIVVDQGEGRYTRRLGEYKRVAHLASRARGSGDKK
jgi:hypothetical protein